MSLASDRSRLHVEGPDDKHALIHLLIQNGIDFDAEPWPAWFPYVNDIGGKDSTLEGVVTAVAVGNGKSMGFVIDANASVENTWRRIGARLRDADVHAPDNVVAEGYVGTSGRYGTRAGVWLMPDNQREGKLEDFLRELISEQDALIRYAETATDASQDHGAQFSKDDRIKAVVHSWLAWKEDPGLRLGTAIRAAYFRHDAPLATRFVSWFRRLYEPA